MSSLILEIRLLVVVMFDQQPLQSLAEKIKSLISSLPYWHHSQGRHYAHFTTGGCYPF